MGRPGVIRSGHFRLVSGLHSDRFLASRRSCATKRPWQSSPLSWRLASAPWQPDLVRSPSTARGRARGCSCLRTRDPASARLARRSRPTGRDDRGGDVAGARILLVNDVVTTGEGLRLLADLVRQRGATVAGAAWFAFRASVAVTELIGAPGAEILGLGSPQSPRMPAPSALSISHPKMRSELDRGRSGCFRAGVEAGGTSVLRSFLGGNDHKGRYGCLLNTRTTIGREARGEQEFTHVVARQATPAV